MTRRFPEDPASYEAIFRYLMVSKVEAAVVGGKAPSDAIREVADTRHITPLGAEETVSTRSLYRWRDALREGGLPGLFPAKRVAAAPSRVLSELMLEFLRAEAAKDARASVPELIRRAAVLGVISCESEVCRTTVWRALKKMGLPPRRRPSKHEGDCRRFAYPHRMMMVLADGKHLRAGARRLRRVALYFLDDATRYGLHVEVGTAEDTVLFLVGLRPRRSPELGHFCSPEVGQAVIRTRKRNSIHDPSSS